MQGHKCRDGFYKGPPVCGCCRVCTEALGEPKQDFSAGQDDSIRRRAKGFEFTTFGRTETTTFLAASQLDTLKKIFT